MASKLKLSSRIDSRAVRERRFQLLQRFHFDLDRHARVERQRGVHRRADAARRRDVVFLDQDAVVEREPLVRAAADAHRVLLRQAQAGQRLARVEDARARAFDRIDETARRGRDARQQLQEVQRRCARRSAARAPGRASSTTGVFGRHPVALRDTATRTSIDGSTRRITASNHGAPHSTASSRTVMRAVRRGVGGNETAGLVAAADVLGQRVRDVALRAPHRSVAVLRADFREQRRHE